MTRAASVGPAPLWSWSLHWLRSPLPVLMALVGVTAGGWAWTSSPAQIAVGHMTSAALAWSGFLLAPLCAGVGARMGQRGPSYGLDEMRRLGTRIGWWDAAVETTAGVGSILLGFAAAAGTLWLRDALTAHSSMDHLWALLLAAALGLCVYYLLGVAVGLRWGSPWAVPVSTAGGFVLAQLLPVWKPAWLLSPTLDLTPNVFSLFQQGLFHGWAMFLAALVVGMVGLLLSRFDDRRIPVALCASAVAVASLGFLRQSTFDGHGYVLARVEVDWSCTTEGAPQVCVHPAFEGHLDRISQTFRALDAKLAGTPGSVPRLEQLPGGYGSVPSPGASAFTLGGVELNDLREGRQTYIADSLLDFDRCATVEAMDAQPWEVVVNDWLIDRAGPVPAEAADAAAWFTGLSEQQRRDWIKVNYTKFATCRLGASDFGAA